ncbi:MAG: hypothetical protein IKV92_04000 [Akkermansia sp.]|nr:hypothetical protein [Akkermansia sp.]
MDTTTEQEEKKPGKMPVIRLGLFAVALSFFLGMYYQDIIDWLAAGEKPPTALRIGAVKDGQQVQTDCFSVRLFQYYLKKEPVGNLTVVPHAVTACLTELKKHTTPELAEAFTPLQLSEKQARSAAAIFEGSFLFSNAADTLDTAATGRVHPTEFSGDLALAHQSINGLVNYYTGGAIERMFSGSSAPRSTRLLAAAVHGFTADWYYPIYARHTEQDFFRNADATRSKVPFLKAEGNFRVVQDPQGKWKAAAMFMRNTPQGDHAGHDSCARILILPLEELPLSARPLATELTTEDFNAIRTALAKAEETAATIKLPRLSGREYRLDMFPSLQAMGLGGLIQRDAAPFPKLSKTTPFPLDGFYQQCSATWEESPDTAVMPAPFNGSATTLEFKRPFIWMLCPLTTPEPPYLMGVVEYM